MIEKPPKSIWIKAKRPAATKITLIKVERKLPRSLVSVTTEGGGVSLPTTSLA